MNGQPSITYTKEECINRVQQYLDMIPLTIMHVLFCDQEQDGICEKEKSGIVNFYIGHYTSDGQFIGKRLLDPVVMPDNNRGVFILPKDHWIHENSFDVTEWFFKSWKDENLMLFKDIHKPYEEWAAEKKLMGCGK